MELRTHTRSWSNFFPFYRWKLRPRDGEWLAKAEPAPELGSLGPSPGLWLGLWGGVKGFSVLIFARLLSEWQR